MDAKAKPPNQELADHQNAPKYEIEELLKTLEVREFFPKVELCLYDGFWCLPKYLEIAVKFQKQFIAHNTDIMLCTNPKCGTTWLKALMFSILNRDIYPVEQSPLLTTNPQLLVPSLGFKSYALQNNIASPRVYSSHFPYLSLPSSIRESKCRIIYICRNPLDQFISLQKFALDNGYELPPLEKNFDMFCEGFHYFGPFWDHVLGFWEAHVKDSHKVLFLKYEDLKDDIISNVKKIADFVGMPFSEEEEKQGLVEQIAKLCSFESLKNLEVNKAENNNHVDFAKNSTFFRKGQVGDWSNYLTPSMARRYQDILESKLEGSGLKFKFS